MNTIENYFGKIDFSHLISLCEKSFNSQIEVHIAIIYGLLTGKNGFKLENVDDSSLFKLKDEVLKLLKFNNYNAQEWHYFYDINEKKINKIILNTIPNVKRFLNELGDNDFNVLHCTLSLVENIKIKMEKDHFDAEIINNLSNKNLNKKHKL
jgi:hypothetical protein